MQTRLFLIKFVLLASSLIHPRVCSPSCSFPAIFNFGDSNSDTGGLSAAFGQAPYPNGQTFFHSPSGRFSDGRLVVDFIGACTHLSMINFVPLLSFLTTHLSIFSVVEISGGIRVTIPKCFLRLHWFKLQPWCQFRHRWIHRPATKHHHFSERCESHLSRCSIGSILRFPHSLTTHSQSRYSKFQPCDPKSCRFTMYAIISERFVILG